MRRLASLVLAALLTACAHKAGDQVPAREYLLNGWKGLSVASIVAGTKIIGGLHGADAAKAAEALRDSEAVMDAATQVYVIYKGHDAEIDDAKAVAEDRLAQTLGDLDAAALLNSGASS